MKTISILIVLIQIHITALSQSAVTSNKVIKLSLTGGNNFNDQTTIYLNASGTSTFNPNEDTLKLFSSNPIANSISSVSDTSDLSANTLPLTTYTVPVRVKVSAGGKYIISRNSGSVLSSATCLYLEDLATNLFTDLSLSSTVSHSFIISDTTTAPRFILHFGQPLSKSSTPPTCSYKQNGVAIVSGIGAGPWDMNWMDAIGNTIANHTNVFTADTLKNLAPGKYIVQVCGNSGFCTTLSDTIEVPATNPIAVYPVVQDVNCSGETTGYIDATGVIGATLPVNYNWSNGDTSATITNLAKGVYILILNDANGCFDTTFYSVNQVSNLSMAFSTSADTVNLSNSSVTFSNQTVGYATVSWNFGDGSPINTNYSPVHTFLNPGTFTVELSASDNLCYDTLTKTVVVQNVTTINSQHLNSNNVLIYTKDTEAEVRFNLQTAEDAEISVYNLEGKLINSKIVSAYANTEAIALGDASGIYLVQVSVSGTKTIKKIIK